MANDRRRPHSDRRGRRSAIAALTTTAMVAGLLTAGAVPAVAAGDTDGSVTGHVFQDFSSSGWYTAGAAEAGVPRSRPVEGVTVTAYDAQGDIVGTALSGSDGAYDLVVDDAFSADIRVEFSDWPAQFEPAFAAQGAEPPSTLGANDTSVQFVEIDPATPTDEVDFGLIVPDQVIQNDAPIATAIQYAGLPTTTAADLSAVVAQPWSATGSSDNPDHYDKRTEVATFEDVGSVWGLSYNRTKNFLVGSATIKRMSGMGTSGLGGIYGATDVLNADGSVNGSSALQPWFALDTDLGIDVGSIGSNASRGIADAQDPAYDTEGFALAARAGIGGIATSLDGDTLFVTNLHDHQVYAIDISGGQVVPTAFEQVETPLAANGQQLWAITVFGDRLYIGYNDTGDDAQGDAQPGVAAADADMKAYVVSVPVVDAVAGTVSAGDWQLELEMSLGYVKGSNMNTWPNTGNKPQLYRWNSWTDEWTWGGDPNTQSVGFDTNWGLTQAYPQPILSGLAFDIDGYLNLGFTDRTSIQSGNLNVPSDPSISGYFETVANGDTLVAGPIALGIPTGTDCPTTASGNFVLECNGNVGDRPTSANGSNDQGPVHGEFFHDSQNLGQGGIHNENTLGAVATYPGVDEVAVTAIDPGPGIYRSGNMWFDQRDGQPSRAFDQVDGVKDRDNPAFEKGGGLGAVALLGVAAPVEIGNRVWLDADLNGRQDPDEPAINGAVVELWTDAGNGTPGELIGTRTTATVDGQPGTYYFRTDDADLSDDDGPKFMPNDDYVLVFPQGTGAVDLQGPHADHEGFDGLQWEDLVRTQAEVSIPATATNGGTSDVNDSNPAVDTGQYALSVGGPGENNHTYDAGWYGLAPFEVLKTVVGPAPADTTYTVNVDAAVNFRGEDRLTEAGADPHGKGPQVTTTTYELTPGVPVASGQDLPYGYALTFSEDLDTPDDTIVFTPSVPGSSPPQGRLVVNPTGPTGEGGILQLGVENRYGSLQVTKSLAGDQEAVEAVGDLAFTVNWETTNLPEPQQSGSFTVTGDGTPAPEPPLTFPAGTIVQLTEATPTDLPPGVAWEGAQWMADGNIEVIDGGATALVTITSGQSELTTAALENTFVNELGSFSVSKQVEGDFALDDPVFDAVSIPIDYSYVDPDSGETVEDTLTLTRGNGFSATGPTLPAGTEVTVSEGTPTGAPPNVAWGDVSWTVDGETAAEPVTFDIGDGTTVELVVTNQVTEVFGTFQVCKDFSGAFDPSAPELADVVITVQWTAPDQRTGTVELTQDGDWCAVPTGDQGAPVTFPLGTVITLEETGRTGGSPDLEWGDVSWLPANPDNSDQGLVTVSSETEPAVATVTNGTVQLVGTFSIEKAIDGDFTLDAPEMANAQFTVTATWDGGSADLVLNQANGWATGLGQNLPTGTVVTLSEAAPSGTGPSVDWGADPTWSGDGVTVNDDGTATITIGNATNPGITVTNTATELRGTFEVSKAVTGDMDLTSPELADAVFTVGWSGSDGQSGSFELVGPDWTGGPVDDTDAAITFPLGTTVTLTEPSITGTGPDVEWGEVSWTPGDQGDGTAVITIDDDETPTAVTLTNRVTQLTGTFGIAKALSGDFDFESPEMQSAVFTVAASWPAAPGLEAGSVEIVLDSANGWAAASGVELPTGTTVTLSEIEVSGTGPSVQWEGASWSGEGLVVNDDGTASFEIGDNTAPVFTVTNEFTELTGAFAITKQVTGSSADQVPDDAAFTVTYTYEGLPAPGELTVGAGETVTSPQIPVGTEVTITEIAPTGTLPDGATWGTPQFILEDGTTSAESVTITITEADEVVQVALENPTVPPLPVTGAGASPLTLLPAGLLILLLGAGIYLVARRRSLLG